MVFFAGEVHEDGALVAAVQRGDFDAFTELYRRHHSSVRGACARRLRNGGDADEIAQAAFVRAFERIDQCDADHSFGPWVHVIARYLCIDSLRERSRVSPHEEPFGGDREGGDEPEHSALQRERAGYVRQALEALPPRQRDVVVARAVHGHGPGEIAAALGLSVSAVDSLLLRGRRRMGLAYQHLTGPA